MSKTQNYLGAITALVLLAVVGLLLAGLATGCSSPSSSSVVAASPAASQACPSGMSPDQYGVCQPGGTDPAAVDPNGQSCTALDDQGYCPGDDPAPATSAAPASPSLTLGQQQAVDSAQSYLSDGQGFSYKGLLEQLTSSSGEGFPQADAKFAISYLHPDWYQQAVESAKNYLSDGQGFSRDELYQQLTSSYGEGFTPGQANYALKAVGM